ncbi:MAG TPA: hypothetical protein VJN18_32700 [Polyangiaceae bacterium]|nr:hypothetical protein [Polyangiaceae bacterium]
MTSPALRGTEAAESEGIVERELKIGDPIVYVDAHSKPHNALVTQVWKNMGGQATGCNLVIVSAEEDKTDPYGRQLERFTSVCHKSVQAAPGWFWCWPEEI